MQTMEQVTAQVAVESILNSGGEGMDKETMRQVLRFARKAQVSAFWLDQLRDLITGETVDEDDCTCGMPTGNCHEGDCNIFRDWGRSSYMPSREGMPNFD